MSKDPVWRKLFAGSSFGLVLGFIITLKAAMLVGGIWLTIKMLQWMGIL